ncbi:hypothetical protein GCM10022380_84940 [Amycolatopsis tucumanensis]|uniref:BFD-like [2Fe-2S]-binding domain-containing protein n=1 Tax=Amycolatopsis tucumanensis TaxID=401106 RepID=A0ABP7JTD6_9PSEU
MIVLARPVRGTVAESQCVAHLVWVPRAGRPEVLAAFCGVEFGPGELELLTGVAGAPCEGCLLRIARVRRMVQRAQADDRRQVGAGMPD